MPEIVFAPNAGPGGPGGPGAPNGPGADPGPGLGRTVFAGLVVVAGLVAAMTAWSMLAPLESAAVAPGAVSVEFDRKTIKHLEGGIVSRILVAEGQRVRAGQVLIELDQTQALAQLELLRGRRAVAAARQARLAAERDGKDGITYPEWLVRERGAADANDARTADILARQAAVFAARKAALASQTAILEKRIGQLDEEIRGLDGEIASSRTGLAILDQEIDTVQTLVKKGLARRPRLLELQRLQAERNGALSRAIAARARADQRIGETKLQINDLHAVRHSEVTEEMRALQTETLELDERLRVARDVLRRSRITAPLDGTVVGLQVHTVGGVVGAAEPLVHIVPADEKLIVEAQIDPIDIDVVRAGLTARVNLTPFNARHSAAIDGTVESVSADSLTDEATGRTYYLARIVLDHDPVAAAADGIALRPGMPAQVMIITGRHTIIEYIVKPITQSFNVAFREE
jgi:HlyD family type I secretion membrane fusion protein